LAGVRLGEEASLGEIEAGAEVTAGARDMAGELAVTTDCDDEAADETGLAVA